MNKKIMIVILFISLITITAVNATDNQTAEDIITIEDDTQLETTNDNDINTNTPTEELSATNTLYVTSTTMHKSMKQLI